LECDPGYKRGYALENRNDDQTLHRVSTFSSSFPRHPPFTPVSIPTTRHTRHTPLNVPPPFSYDVECTSHGEDATKNEPFASQLFSCDAPGVDRFHFEGNISDADMSDYYLPPFERPMSSPDAKPAAIMCSFPTINGVPSCANSLTQNTLARDTW
jgi:hypothetical protein